MPTKAAAFHAWASGFGLKAYAAESVPEGAPLPYITYVLGFAGFGEEYPAELDVWHTSTAKANAVCEAIGDALGQGGEMLPCDGGAIWLKKGSPFWQAVADEPGVYRRYVNIDIENLTA